MPLGVNLGSLTKVLKCAKDDDICTLKAADEADLLNLVYEAKSESCFLHERADGLVPPWLCLTRRVAFLRAFGGTFMREYVRRHV